MTTQPPPDQQPEQLEWSKTYKRKNGYHRFAVPTASALMCWVNEQRRMEQDGFSMKQVSDSELELCWTTKDPDVMPPDIDEYRLPRKRIMPEPDIKIDETGLLSYQPPSVKYLLQALATFGSALDASDAGVGKTYVSCAAARHLKRRMVVICPKPVTYTWKEVAEYLKADLIEAVGYEKVKTGNTPHGHWANDYTDEQKAEADKLRKSIENTKDTTQAKIWKKQLTTYLKGCREDWIWEWTLPADAILVFDEGHRCLPAGEGISTTSGVIPIERIAVGNLVETPIGPRKVTKVFRTRRNKRLLKLVHENGSVTATENHRFFTTGGRKELADIENGDTLYIHETGQTSTDMRNLRNLVQIEEGDAKVLHTLLQDYETMGVSRASGANVRKHDSAASTGYSDASRSIETDERSESNGERRHTEEDAPLPNMSGAQTNQARGKWTAKPRTGAPSPASYELESRALDRDRGQRTEPGASETLLNRLGSTSEEVGARTRRELSCRESETSLRREEGQLSTLAGMASATHPECRSFCESAKGIFASKVLGVFPSYQEDEWVYDLEVEEAHCYYAEGVLVSNCKSPTSQNGKLMLAAKRQNILTIVASATLADSPAYMRSVGYLLGLHNDDDFDRWAGEYGCYRSRWGALQFDKDPEDLYRLHCDIFPEKGTRIKISDLGDKFPETLITSELFDMDENTTKIQKVYDEMEMQLQMLQAGLNVEKGMNMLTIILRARMRIELLKAPTYAQLALDAIEEGQSVAIFVNFSDTLKWLATKLKTDCLIWGQQTPTRRKENIQNFKDNKRRICIANIRAGGVGVSLHDLHHQYQRLALISPNYSAIDLTQSLGRVHRAGGDNTVQRIVFAANTIEDRICKAVRRKLQCLNSINDGDLNEGITIDLQKFSLENISNEE